MLCRTPIDVLFVVPRLGGGGAERVFTTLMIHLDRARFRPALAVQDRTGEYSSELPEDVEILDLPQGRFRYALPALLTLLWRRRPAIVVTTRGYVNLLLALAHPLLPPGVAHVARQTALPGRVLGNGLTARLKGLLYRRRLPAVDLLVCQSRDMWEDLIGPYRFPSDRTTVIHNPVDMTRIRDLARAPIDPGPAKPGRVHLVAAGRLVPQKGFDLLLDALASTGDRYHLTILGEGPERAALDDRARTLGVARRVHFLPFTPNPFAHMARADAVVLSSRHEGFPNVLLEAGACGAPCIAFRCPGGIDEILIEGMTGLMVPPEDVRGLATAITGDRYLKMDRGRIIAETASRFSVEVVVPQYEREFARLASP